MASEESMPLALLVRLLPKDRAAGIRFSVSCAGDQSILTEPGEFVVRIWWENRDVLRASIKNVRSGTVAMMQGNGALRELARELFLRVEDSET